MYKKKVTNILKRLNRKFIYPIKRLFFRFKMFYNYKLQEIPLYQIHSREKFNLGDPNYNYAGLYKSLLKTKGLDTKNYSSVIVVPIVWAGDNGNWRKEALTQGFKYEAFDGNHRVATLQFINLSKKLKKYSVIKIKAVVATSEYYSKLQYYGYLHKFKGNRYER